MEKSLTVLLVTYNQSRFIEETLRSVLSQKTEFPFHILVADDCSTDDTREKIRALASTTEVSISFAEAAENVGVLKNYRRGFAQCSTEFIAVMEGDDLWTNPYRLQKHVDCLRAHPECPMSFNRFLVANYDQGQFSVNPDISNPDHDEMLYVFGEDLALDNVIGNFSTCVYRRQSIQAMPADVYEEKAYDWLFHIVLSKLGPIAFLPEVMNIYRVHANGSWSKLSPQERIADMMHSIKRYDQYTGGIYHEAFSKHLARLSKMSIHAVGKNAAPKTMKYRLRRLARAIYRYMPPVFLLIAKLLISPALIQKLSVLLSAKRGGKNNEPA